MNRKFFKRGHPPKEWWRWQKVVKITWRNIIGFTGLPNTVVDLELSCGHTLLGSAADTIRKYIECEQCRDIRGNGPGTGGADGETSAPPPPPP